MKNRAQSILEYVIIVGVAAAAIIAMQVYFRRAVNARLEEIKQEYVPKITPSGPPGTPSGPPGTPSGPPGTPSGPPGTPSGPPGTPSGPPGTPSGPPGTPSGPPSASPIK